MPFLSLGDGGCLHYEMLGEGPPLLLVTGLSGLASFWAGLAPRLAERYRVVLHDHRGTGQSSPSLIDYSVEQMADDLLQLMDDLGIERAHLVGHSTGGAIGQVLAIERPERIDRLVLSASWTAADAYFRRLFEQRALALRQGGPRAYVRSSTLALMPSWWIRDNEAELEADEPAAAERVPPAEIMLSRIAAILRFDRRAQLPRISAPTLVLGARDDQVTPAYYSEELGRLIPGAETVILPAGGHFFPQIVPDGFLRVLEAFLTRP